MSSEKLAYSINEIARLSGLGRTSIYKAIAEGTLVARKAGRRTVVLATDLTEWLNSLAPAR
jgi:excisionase family DNA binding protein